MADKILFVVFGTRELIENLKQNQKHYPKSSNSIELNNHKGLKEQIEYIHTDQNMAHKEYIILHVYEYSVDILNKIVEDVKGLKYLKVKFLVLNDDNNDEDIEDIQDLIHAINRFQGKIGQTKQIQKKPKNKKAEEQELNKLLPSDDAMMNLDSVNFLIDVTRNFDRNKENMGDEVRDSIYNSLVALSMKLEIENEKLLDKDE